MPRPKTSASKQIIVCSSEQHARWATWEFKKDDQENVKILAPELKEQLILRKSRLPYLQYFESPFCSNVYYRTDFKRLSKLAQTLARFTQEVLAKDIMVQGIPLIDLCQILLEHEIFEVLYNYEYFCSLEKTWHPTRYIVSSDEHVKLGGWSSGFFSLAGYLNDYFVPKDRLSHFRKDNLLNVRKRLGSLTRHRQAFPDVKAMGEIIKQRILQKNEKKVDTGDFDFLLFSGGINLYYYHTLFTCLKEEQSPLRFINLTGPQILEDELILRRTGVPFKSLSDFEVNLRDRISKEQKVAMSKISQATLLLKRRLHNQRLPNEVKETLANKVGLVLKNNVNKLIRQLYLADEALTFYRPRLMITTHDPGPSALPFVLLAQKRKIPTLVLIHAWQNSTFGMNHRSNHVAVWGKETARWYIDVLKKDKKTVHEVGFPFFDPLYTKRIAFWQNKTPLSILAHHIRLGLLLTLYPERSFGWTKFIDELCRTLIKSKLQYTLDIRTHRGQKLQGVKELSTLYAIPMRIDEKIPREDFIKRNDIIISWDTTAFLWAMLYGKPLFCTTPFWGKGLSPITKYGAAWEPNSAEELVNTIDKLKTHPNLLKKQRQGQRRFLLDVVGNDDGRSTEKLLRLIKRLSHEEYEK